VTFFRRFFVHNSLITYDPRIIMYACIFLAGKIEDQYVSIETDLLRVSAKFTMHQILAAELDVLEVGTTNTNKHPLNTSHFLSIFD